MGITSKRVRSKRRWIPCSQLTQDLLWIKRPKALLRHAIEYLWKPGLDPAPKIVSINKALKTYAKQNNFIYLDYFAAMADDNDGLKVPDYTAADDLVHPNKAGYLVMEKLAEKAIEDALNCANNIEKNWE